MFWEFVSNNIWVTVGIAVVLGILGEVGFRVFYRWFGRVTQSTTTHLDDLLLKRMRYPVRIAVWLGVILFVVHLHPQLAVSWLRKAIDVIEAALLIYIVVETFDTLLIDYVLIERRKVEIPHLLRDLGRVVVFSLLGVALMRSVFNTDLSAFVATSTVITVVLGLALQSTLGNLFSGMAIHVERPFRIGDWILYRHFEGKVVRLGWRSTVLQNFDGDYITVPNNNVSTTDIVNFYAPTKLHARKLRVITKHSSPPRDFERAIALAVGRVPLILDEPAHKTWLIEYSPLAVVYVVKFWIADFARHDDIESDLMKQIWYAFEEIGLELPSAATVLLSRPDDDPMRAV